MPNTFTQIRTESRHEDMREQMEDTLIVESDGAVLLLIDIIAAPACISRLPDDLHR